MISNERPSPYGSGNSAYNGSYPKPSSAATLESEVIQIERKAFTIALKENQRGRFLSITEDVGGRRDTILIPAPGLAEFRRVFEEMVKTASEIPGNRPE